MLSIFFVAASTALNKREKKLKEQIFGREVLSKAFHQSRFTVCSIEMRQVG
jgi:hypothetical protein